MTTEQLHRRVFQPIYTQRSGRPRKSSGMPICELDGERWPCAKMREWQQEVRESGLVAPWWYPKKEQE